MALFGRKQPRFDYIQVRPGESGTAIDAFDSFTYWVPSEDLRRQLLRQAAKTGRHGQPDPTAVSIPELDDIKEFRQLTRQAAFNCANAAGQLFAKDRGEIMKLVSVLTGTAPADKDAEVTEQVRRSRLQVLSGHIDALEAALNRRLDTIGSHYDGLRDRYMTALYAAHPYERELHARGWTVDGFHISDAMRDFGQAEPRAQIAKLT
jgi:hypothetical protein